MRQASSRTERTTPQREPTYYPGAAFRWRPADIVDGALGPSVMFVAKSSAHVYLPGPLWHYATLDLVLVLIRRDAGYHLQLYRWEFDSRQQPALMTEVTQLPLRRSPNRGQLEVYLSLMVKDLGCGRCTAHRGIPPFSIVVESRVQDDVLQDVYNNRLAA